MAFMRTVRRKLKSAVAPTVFLALLGYFSWNVTRGNLGLQSYHEHQADMMQAAKDLEAAKADLASWERRIKGLGSSRLDTDSLDERSRAMLNLADPTDIVVMYPKGDKLF
ncbi:Septum formation initiator [Granulibacter bethesdensis]|uniref:Septum formation initiator n=2 Tax=Granulibacter bethesdensis TaxID=364410 RepID=Q0BSX2_GRABC|nr:septum formation initiator family protein [Granulibacter bethesdensis]ABI62080.1 Septum formation initiator [Granulibacter bethesdensis CGDNIH1]AHJ69021.1 Septum formation initiator [Granulibacter bethesdensis]APH51903.1 Septum formation initiator [Granulibacter bethesdensis]APH59507.1 Septum formation initiator [Granulibacter bethesdensis]APH64593.1 Septum formation initiator [Granulibacter bethesdensis]